ncbi:MAG: Sulfotransferase family, partial [Candidatus Sulfotelmatobacter sp.]|nr:Sulfotransferase family [Candidatus Sulfotelmatobacter sp.]
MTSEPSSGPIFVVGIWRSGTSLLYTLMNQHPQIALTYESDLF